jgi:hypothetical protein
MIFSRPAFEISGIIAGSRDILEKKGMLNAQQKKVFTNLSNCRTQALGYLQQPTLREHQGLLQQLQGQALP